MRWWFRTLTSRGAGAWLEQEARLADREASLIARQRAEDAKLPAGMWTQDDFYRVVEGDSDGHQVTEAIRAGHLRDLGIGAIPRRPPCGLHGDACGLDRSHQIPPAHDGGI